MNEIIYNLMHIRNKIKEIKKRYGRSSEEVTLLAVSKAKSINIVEKAVKAGQRLFGENYVKEGVEKILYFQKIGILDLEWHFIGSLQANKSRLVAEYFDWCHTIDRLHIASRLNEQRPLGKTPLNVLIQINISNEKSKSGIELTTLDILADEISKLPQLKLRGLMAMPSIKEDYEQQFRISQKMMKVFLSLKTRYQSLDTLSLGTSNDMEAAIAAGSTMVRIGNAIFGEKNHSR